jgi:pyoverdine/dityrosine biosynthesis protein Dit1/AcrR family transcriptional regulator
VTGRRVNVPQRQAPKLRQEQKLNTFTFMVVASAYQDRALRSRLRMLEAATGCFVERGYDATSMQDIAAAAGVSVGLVCRYFPTREHLALAVFDRLADELAEHAVALAPGTLAERFVTLMHVRIAQIDHQRRPLTALLGKAVDPQSPLYALGEATESMRAKVSGALGVVVAGALDAPGAAKIAATTTQLLYTLHLGVVLATLARPESSFAKALVEQMGHGLKLLRLPMAHTFINTRLRPMLLDKARPVDVDVVRDILAILFRDNRVLPGVTQGLTKTSEALHRPRVESAVRAQRPIELVLPAFPAKSPSLEKVLGPLPDLAEVRALERLHELLDQIEARHEYGAQLTICSDGHVFADLVGVSDDDVSAYKRALLALVDDPRIRWFDLGTAFGDDLAPAALRAQLVARYAETEADLRARAGTSASLRAQIDGIHRFLADDEPALVPGITKNQARKQTRPRAYEVVRRSEAWGALVADVFPQALRLSIHPQPDPSTKIGMNLLGVDDPWLTPWHGCAVVSRQGTRLMHRKDAEAIGAVVVVDDDGRPSHLELPNQTALKGGSRR